MPEFYQIISTFLMAAFKYMVAVFMSFGYGLGFFFSTLVCTVGGIAGVGVYLAFGELISNLYQKYVVRKIRKKIPINRKTRAIIWLKHHHGLVGIAVLTPIFLSVPIGTFAAVALNYPWRRILLFMAVSFLGWSLLFFGTYEISGLKLHQYLRDLIQ